MELLGSILGGLIPTEWTLYILAVALLISEILPHIPERYIKSNSSLQLLYNIVAPLSLGIKDRLLRRREFDEEVMNEYEAEYDMKKNDNPMGGD